VRFPPIQHYHNLIRRRLAPNNATEIPPARNEKNRVDKRAGNARFTRYAAGLGACGGHNKDSDFIVALNQPQWDGGSHCYETITITYNDKSVQAQIVDKCVGCPSNALDLSNGLFAFLAPGQDMTYGDWSFGSSTPSKTPPPLPESTTSSSSKSKSSSSSSFNFSSTLASMTTTAAAAAETTISADDPQVLNQVNIAVINLGGLISAGRAIQV
jgi:hypothetical protein